MWPKLTPQYYASRDFDISEISPTRESNTNGFRGKQARYQLLHEAPRGPDGIPAEFWKVLGAKGTTELVELCKEMYVKGIWPSDVTRVVMIPLQKKMNAVECSDHRTISLISHASKILLKILTNRIE